MFIILCLSRIKQQIHFPCLDLISPNMGKLLLSNWLPVNQRMMVRLIPILYHLAIRNKTLALTLMTAHITSLLSGEDNLILKRTLALRSQSSVVR